MTTTVDERGRIVIPKALRDRYGLAPGDDVIIESRDDGLLIRPVQPPNPSLGLLGIIGPHNIDPDAPPIDPMDVKRLWEGWR